MCFGVVWWCNQNVAAGATMMTYNLNRLKKNVCLWTHLILSLYFLSIAKIFSFRIDGGIGVICKIIFSFYIRSRILSYIGYICYISVHIKNNVDIKYCVISYQYNLSWVSQQSTWIIVFTQFYLYWHNERTART